MVRWLLSIDKKSCAIFFFNWKIIFASSFFFLISLFFSFRGPRHGELWAAVHFPPWDQGLGETNQDCLEMGWWEEEGEGGKEASGGMERSRGRSYVLLDPPVRSRTPPPPPQPRLLGDLLLLLLVFGGLFSCRMTGGPAPTPNSPVSNTQFGFIVLPAQTEIFCRVKQWSCELPGSSACFSTSVPFCLSVCLLHPFLNSLGPHPPRPPKSTQPSLQPAVVTFDLCIRGVISRRNSFVFSSKKKPIWFLWPWRQCPRLCRFSIYYVSKWKRILLFCEIIQRGGNSTLLFLFVFICCVIK